ncbi:hypothetical protein B0T13DRAFT_53845 [Neurospora crassa]|nr:hypothetical protein B0T13DRAFT_53845 [Neurospora crassa]
MQQPSSKYHNQTLNSATRVLHSHTHIRTWAHSRGGVRLCPFSVWRWQPRLSPHFQPLQWAAAPRRLARCRQGAERGKRDAKNDANRSLPRNTVWRQRQADTIYDTDTKFMGYLIRAGGVFFSFAYLAFVLIGLTLFSAPPLRFPRCPKRMTE